MRVTNRTVWAGLVATFVSCAWGGDSQQAKPAVADVELTTPRAWFRAAAEQALKIERTAMFCDVPERRPLPGILIAILQTQVEKGDAEGAVALAKEQAQLALPSIARVQAGKGDVAGALATVGLITEQEDKNTATRVVVDGLIEAGKLADAKQVLQDRPVDEITGSLYRTLGQAQAVKGDVAGALASADEIDGKPEPSGLNEAYRAEVHVAIAVALAQAGDKPGALENLAKARKLTEGLRPPYASNTLKRIARVQADAGYYEAAEATLNALNGTERRSFPDVVLAAQVQRGDVKPADALAKVTGYSLVYEAAIQAQLQANDYKGAAQTLKIAKGVSIEPTRIVDAFLKGGDVDGAVEFVDGMTSLVKRGEGYGHLAVQRTENYRAKYKALIAKAVECFKQVVDPPPGSSIAHPRKEDLLGALAMRQVDLKDFAGAQETIAEIEERKTQERYEIELRARELASGENWKEAQEWVASLATAADRAQACRLIATYMNPKGK